MTSRTNDDDTRRNDDDTQQEQEKEQQQRERQHHDWDPFRFKRIGLSRRQEQQRAAMGPCCETGRDAASAKCKAACGAVVSWECRHFCLFCSLRVPLPFASPSPTPSPSPSRSRSRHRSRCPSPSSPRQHECKSPRGSVNTAQQLRTFQEMSPRTCVRALESMSFVKSD